MVLNPYACNSHNRHHIPRLSLHILFQISYPLINSKYRDIRHCWIIVNWQNNVAVRLVVVVRTTTVVPSVRSIVLRISVFSPFLRPEHFSIKSCVLIPLVTIVTALSCCLQLHDSHLCAFALPSANHTPLSVPYLLND